MENNGTTDNMNDFSNIIHSEKEYGLQMERLTETDYAKASEFAQSLASYALSHDLSPAGSAAFARLICRFLLSKKSKSRLPQTIQEDTLLRKAIFGSLNTYKYSLVYLLKRVWRQNDTALTRNTLDLLKKNPFAVPDAKPWSDRWSLSFLIEESLKAPEDYLGLTEENKAVIEEYR